MTGGRTVTGLRLVNHSRESMLQTSAHFTTCVDIYDCVIVLHLTVNVVNVCQFYMLLPKRSVGEQFWLLG